MIMRALSLSMLLIGIPATALAEEAFLQCEGTQRILGNPPMNSEADFSLKVDLDASSLEYDGRVHRIYDAGDTEIGAFTTFQSRDRRWRNLVTIKLDRVSGRFSAMWISTEPKSDGGYYYESDRDPGTRYDPTPITTIDAECRPGKRLF